MDVNNLRLGSAVASPEQLKYGTYASSEYKTGPDMDYFTEAQDVIKKEAMKRDGRIKDMSEITIERTPERMPRAFAGADDKRIGYINGRFRVFFYYFIQNGGKFKANYGFGVVKIDQQKSFPFLVKQVYSIEKFQITSRE